MKNSLINTLAAVRTTTTRTRRLVIALAAIAGTQASLISPAAAAIVGYDYFTTGNLTDFGSGYHQFGQPTGPARVTWDYSLNAQGLVVVKAMVHGIVYKDWNICAKASLQIRFTDADGDLLSVRRIMFCACGGFANDPANWRSVAETFTHVKLRRVEIQTGWTLCETANVDFGPEPNGYHLSLAPEHLYRPVRFNNGVADFGRGLHVDGSPTGSGYIHYRLLRDGRFESEVNGTLYYDSTIGGAARMTIEWLRPDGTVIKTETIDEYGPMNGNANQASNQSSVDKICTNQNVYSVRVRLGRLYAGTMISPRTWTYAFFECVPWA